MKIEYHLRRTSCIKKKIMLVLLLYYARIELRFSQTLLFVFIGLKENFVPKTIFFI